MRGSHQKGVALLTALLIVALVSIIGASMITRMNISVHRSGNLWQDEQAWWYVVGIENWIGQILQIDGQNSKIDALNEAWAQPVNYLPIDVGAIQGQIIDLQGRFNLNNLAAGDKSDTKIFERLIAIAADTDALTAQTIAESTRDWIDADNNPTLPYGAEDDYYLGQNPAYRAGNQIMVDPSEFRMVRGVTEQLYAALQPFITALPTKTPINVNTASATVLASLTDGITPAVAQALAEKRLKEPWDSVQTFLQEDALAGKDIPTEGLSVSTNYFQAVGLVAVDRGQLRFHSTFARTNGGRARMIAHSRNVN